MDLGINTNRQVTANTKTTAATAGTAAKATAPKAANASNVSLSTPVPDEVVISPQARAAMTQEQSTLESLPQAVETQAIADSEETNSNTTTFTSFTAEFDKLTQAYTETVRQYYTKNHNGNLVFEDPAGHAWDKYKNEDSPYFRNDMSTDERAWAYDQEIDLLYGGKHLQLSNPYAFASAGGSPTLENTAKQANLACREQIDQSIQDIFAANGIELSDDTSFRLAVDSDSYSIRVLDMEDQEQAAAIEQALNRGDNGKNLYHHLKVTSPDSESAVIAYANGHLAALDPQEELSEQAMDEVKQQVGSTYARYSTTYNPQQKPLNDEILSLHPSNEYTQEYTDRLSATVRVAAPELVANFRAHSKDNQLPVDPPRNNDDISDLLHSYMQAYAQPAQEAKTAIANYYADAHAENSSYPLLQGLDHIAQKYNRPDSSIFRADLPEAQRDMAYRQERALLTGARVTLNDPYALAAIGGVQNAKDSHQAAMQAVMARLNEIQSQQYGVDPSKLAGAGIDTKA